LATDTQDGAAGALGDLRVLDLSEGIAGAVAAMMFGDHGADVVRADASPPREDPPPPGELAWHRNKTVAAFDRDSPADRQQLRRLLGRADVVVVDRARRELERTQLDEASVTAANPGAVHLWLPGYGVEGRWSELRPDADLLAAACGVADAFNATVDRPVLPVVPILSYEQGILGATAAMAAIVERDRTGTGRPVIVSGLHAASALIAVNIATAPGTMRPLKGTFSPLPHYRHYRCADGRWLYLAALTEPFFVRALEVLDLFDVLVMPGVDGEFLNLMIPEAAAPVAERIGARFAERPRDHWLQALDDAGVPNAPVESRQAYVASELAAELPLRTTVRHETLGAVHVPEVPIWLSRTPGRVRTVPDRARRVDLRSAWTDERASSRSSSVPASRSPGVLPLAGLRILDLSSFVAGPLGPAILADLGADVVKVETIDGDAYRNFGLSFLAINQRKRGVSIDLKQADGFLAVQRVAARCDVVVDNVRPVARARLGLEDAIRAIHPEVVTCTTSGFGDEGRLAQYPGFDPVLQARAGVMVAQGGDGDPVFSTFPVHDIVAGTLGAFGTLCALHHRALTGVGQAVHVSLAAASTLVQLGELTTYEGAPPAQTGGVDWPGPHAAHRLYQCGDGWIAVAADTSDERRGLLDVLGCSDVQPEDLLRPDDPSAAALINAFGSLQASAVVERLAAAGVPAVEVLPRQRVFDDPWLAANEMFHTLQDPSFGPCTVIRGFVQRPASATPADPRRAPRLGEHTIQVLLDAGYDEAGLENLLRPGIVRAADR
jgi:crotonobetainyl-CoA:carnitine CoA-transferase CaiB-like acyl-CoA transferase